MVLYVIVVIAVCNHQASVREKARCATVGIKTSFMIVN